ncbi:MAG: hypothetical protein A2786_00985 [Candidatus Chisholmbacteria bacterium RIFCSPHIGHO2_01_FULL_52_32]|uniref:NAD-dependent epimerase/dehydratase domain-containing protein n=1 Tax=Candidatus Chisholmbacteria bacterium RIFCSPHIGHO2_01_FULL_52_32 TaxID=1797591 RepID=A0A1G1VUW6_9BACT|nr:MAG: hypothetical protein A2786_00985 [Candidatus Chisholmbacteria bacterium RIFCSPHIGHO2_01_FULL_52_32]
MKKNISVLLTGAHGFIGLHTEEALRTGGYSVRDFAGDVRSRSDWEANISGGEVVVHLAGIRTETEADFAVNTQGTENLFVTAVKTGRLPAKVVLGSSQAVYLGLQPPFSEDQTPSPTTIYGKSKFFAERAAREVGKRMGIPVVILRCSTVLGAGIREESGMSGPLAQWVRAGFAGKPIRVNRDGMQRRDYVHVDDVAAANVLAAERLPEGIFNVGGQRRVRLLTLAGWVKQATGGRSVIKIAGGKASAADPREMLSDINKLCGYGWKPRRTAKEAVAEYVMGVRSEEYGEGRIGGEGLGSRV